MLPAVISNKEWCIRTGGRLCCKRQENDGADSEFCERRRNAFANGGNNLFFVGSDMSDKRQLKIRCFGYTQILSDCRDWSEL